MADLATLEHSGVILLDKLFI